MYAIQVVEIEATTPKLRAAAVLFDCYRIFYGKLANLSLAKNYLRERLEAGESTVLLARLQDQWVGLCRLYRGFSSISCARTAIHLYVDDGHRSAGVGGALINYASAYARRVRAARVVLETAETNARVQALYDSLGFERSRGFWGYSLCLCPV